MTVIEATRAWVREKCPLIDRNNRFNINALGATATEYTLNTAGETHRQDVCGYDHEVCNLVFAARVSYDATLAAALSAADFFSGLSAWIQAQERAHNYPAPVDGYRATKITSANPGILMQADADTAVYQLQIQILLEEE